MIFPRSTEALGVESLWLFTLRQLSPGQFLGEIRCFGFILLLML